MSRKLIAIFLIAALLCGMVIGCGKNDASTDPSGSSDSSQVSSTPADDSTGDTQDSVQPSGTDTTPQDSTPTGNEDETTAGSQTGGQDSPVQDTKPQQGGTSETTGMDEPIIPNVPDVSVPDSNEVTFMDYHSMSGEEQMAFINSFDSADDFAAWHAAARQAYEDSMIEIDGTTPINAGDILGGN